MRLTTEQNGTHYVTIPNHSPVKLGTLRASLKAVGAHHGLTIDELVRKLRL
jgi:hypothetical protein